MRSRSNSPEARVRHLLDVARRIADPDDPLGRRARTLLAASTGLSPEGIELGLTQHLERDMSDAEWVQLADGAGTASTVTVILSSNVFVATLRALALALAAAPIVTLKPSRREPHMAELLLQGWEELGLASCFRLVAEVDWETQEEVHVYGSLTTVQSVRNRLPARCRLRAHPAGFGIAAIAADEPEEELARALSWDVVPFDQRGCLSPRVVLVRGEHKAERFTEALHAELAQRQEDVPRGPLHPEERAEFARYRDTLLVAGTIAESPGGAVGLGLPDSPLCLPPTGRHVHVLPVRSEDAVSELLRGLAPYVTCVGHGPHEAFGDALQAWVPRARRAPLSRMQKPPLDGPVDRRALDAEGVPPQRRET